MKMERLTRKIEKSSWRDRGRKPSGYTSDYTKQEVVGRLAAYEDLGTVEELATLTGEMKTAYDENHIPYMLEAEGSEAKHIIGLLQAESEGRLIVFSTAEYADVARAAVVDYEYVKATETSEAAALAAMEGRK